MSNNGRDRTPPPIIGPDDRTPESAPWCAANREIVRTLGQLAVNSGSLWRELARLSREVRLMTAPAPASFVADLGATLKAHHEPALALAETLIAHAKGR